MIVRRAVLIAAACAGCSGDDGETCPFGTHTDEVSGECAEDPAYAVVESQSAVQHWLSNQRSGIYELQFTLGAETGTPAGTGIIRFLQGDRPEVSSFTWAEGPDVAAMQITETDVHTITELTSIVPDVLGPTATSFTTSIVDQDGTQTYTFTLVAGALELPPPREAIAVGQAFDTQDAVQGLLVDGTSAYWTASGNVRSVPLEGGTVGTLASGFSTTRGIDGFTTDGTTLFWSGRRSAPADSGVYSMPKSGGTVAAPLVSSAQLASSDTFGSLFIEGTSLYFSAWPAGASDSGGLWTVTTAGTSPTLFVTQGPGEYAAAVAIDSLGVDYFHSPAPAGLYRAPFGGGGPDPVNTSCSGATSPVVADASNLYCLSSDALLKIPVDGGPVVSLATILPSDGAHGLAVDGANVYLAVTSAIWVVPVSPPTAPAEPEVLVPDIEPVGPLALDAQFLYWTDRDGSVYKMGK